MLLLGTTDTLHEGPPDEATVTDEDVRTILAEAGSAIDGVGPVRASFHGLRVLPGGAGRDCERTARDRVHPRADGDAQRRRRQADDLPPHRAGRARAARGPQPEPRASAAAGRRRARHARVARRARRGDAAATCSTSTARWRPTCSARRSRTRRCSSGSCRAGPICARRTPGRDRASSRFTTRTCSAGELPPGSVAS